MTLFALKFYSQPEHFYWSSMYLYPGLQMIGLLAGFKKIMYIIHSLNPPPPTPERKWCLTKLIWNWLSVKLLPSGGCNQNHCRTPVNYLIFCKAANSSSLKLTTVKGNQVVDRCFSKILMKDFRISCIGSCCKNIFLSAKEEICPLKKVKGLEKYLLYFFWQKTPSKKAVNIVHTLN